MPRRRAHRLRQLPYPGGREYTFAALDPAIRAWGNRDADRDGVHPSFVVNNALSAISGVDILETVEQAQHRKPRKSK